MDEEMSTSLEESNQVSIPGGDCKEERMRRVLDDSEEDGSQVVKQQRMKGLKDLGIGASSLSKRKRSQTPHVQEFLKKKSRLRPLKKVLESTTTAAVSVPVIIEQTPLAQDRNAEGLVPILVSPKPEDVADGQSSQSIQDITKSSGNKESVESDSTSSAVVDIKDKSQIWAVSKWQSKGKRKSRQMGTHKEIAGSSVNVKRLLGWNSPYTLWGPHRSLPYRQPFQGYRPVYDVHLEVKANYHSKHVPYISLMSNLNGQAIIGHPITVQVLDESVCDNLVGKESERKRHMSKYDTQNNMTGVEDKPVGLKAKANQSRRKNSAKNLKQSKSSNLRKTCLTSKKIRKLSSLTGSQKRSQNGKKLLVGKGKGPVIACVPLKVVFSRIKASFNSSMRLMAALSSSNP